MLYCQARGVFVTFQTAILKSKNTNHQQKLALPNVSLTNESNEYLFNAEEGITENLIRVMNIL